MIWFAWFNGSLYVELHGREDGRTRLLVFLQMGILALLAVFTGEAGGATGQPFAIVYAVFLALMGWAWYAIRELDRAERPEFLRITAFYVGGMVISTIVVAATAVLSPDAGGSSLWAVFLAGWIGFILLGLARQRPPGRGHRADRFARRALRPVHDHRPRRGHPRRRDRASPRRAPTR